MLSGFRSVVKERTRGTPLFGPLQSAHRAFVKHVEIPVGSVVHTRSVRDQAGYYRIKHQAGDLPSFWMYLPDGRSLHRLNCLRGQLEPEVMGTISEYVTPETTLWDIGACRGYFSLPAAAVADQVTAFEANPEQAEELRRSVKKNGYSNYEIVTGIVGENVSLDDYAAPDLVKMDVEGWEYTILSESPETVADADAWIIEMHENGSHPAAPDPPRVDDEGVVEILESAGYTTKVLEPNPPQNYHLFAYR